ncbi:hypothetical protein BgAZ_400150 [Babesia gibsoni]|uniref:Uncharacterized protein n=1 Tax=Babesia gibsoni TaxID=33632 RepID=A0AAD8LR18_BABGI|nr:hypothetical protein BgAZ_400150 [Babesia gibsoni]
MESKENKPVPAPESKQTESKSSGLGVVRQGLTMLLGVLSFVLRGVYRFFLATDEVVEDPTGKRGKKHRIKQPVLSLRFIRIALLFASLVLGVFFVGILKMAGLTPQPKLPGFTYLNVGNHNKLKEIMAQPGPRIIYCKNAALQPLVRRAISHTMDALPSYINRFALDCNAKLPSGRTAYERFEVDPHKTVMIIQAHGKKAKGLNESLLANPPLFYSVVSNDTQYALKHVQHVESFNEQFGKSTNRSLLIVTDGMKVSLYSREHASAISRVVDKNRMYNLTVWLVNHHLFELTFNEKDDAPDAKALGIYCLVPYEGGHLFGQFNGAPFGKAMEAFMRSCSVVVKPNRDFKQLNGTPKLVNRVIEKDNTKKVDDEVQAKIAELGN